MNPRVVSCHTRLPALLFGVLLLSGFRVSAQTVAPAVTAQWHIDRTRVYLGETFMMTLSIRADGVRLGKAVELDGMPDTAALERTSPAELPLERKQEGGRVVETRRFRFEVTPRRLGPVRLAPVLRVGLMQRQRMLIGSAWVETSQTVRVVPITLTVLPVPEKGKPADFSGAIGSFTFDVSLSPTELAPGDLITARIRIQGNGKFEGIRVPRFSPDRHFKVYDPEPVKEETAVTRHVYTQVLIPQSTNATQVGSISFSYFDALAGQYRSITRGPFKLRLKQRHQEVVDRYRPPEDRPAENSVSLVVKQTWKASPAARVALALALYWILAIGLVAWVLISLQVPVKRGVLRRAVTGAGLLLVFLLGSIPYRSTVARTLGGTHMATATRQVAARVAPSHNALETCTLPANATIQIDEGWEDWVRVSDGERRGWIPADAVKLE